jgi:predicted Zn-dependent peptidase
LIGSMTDLDAASLEDIAHFFATYYTPDNAVLTIAGDFDPKGARDMIARHFAPISKGSGRPPLPDMRLPNTFGSTLREVVEDDVMLPRVFIASRAPVFGSAEYYATSVLGAVLGLKKGSRLHRHLVREQQVAAEATAFTYDLSKGSDLLVVDVTARPETTAGKLEQAVMHELDQLIAEPVSDDEVARAVALVETDLVVAMQSAGERADRLSMFATYFGDPGLINHQTERYRAVTAADVNAIVSKRLRPENRAVLLYVPRAQNGNGSDGKLAMVQS